MSKVYATVERWWAIPFAWTPPCLMNPLQLFPPLADLSTFLVICAQCVWTWYFIAQGLGNGIEYDTSAVFGILTATLGFILPLQMNAALGKNRACLDNYNAMMGDVQALAWDVIAFHTGDSAEVTNEVQKSENILSMMFDIIIAMPAVTKWHFRGGADLEKLTTKRAIAFKNTPGGSEIDQLLGKIPSMPAPEACFFKLLDYIKDLTKSKSQVQQGASLRSWERAYGSWGNMGNLSAYQPPSLFSYVLNVALLLYSVLLPYQFMDNGYHAVWMVAIVGYFFLGLNAAGRKVGNAFAEQNGGFQTVSESQRGATNALAQIWRAKDVIFEDPKSTPQLMRIGRQSTFLGNAKLMPTNFFKY